MYSFDVFDTVITRTTATPKGIFALMQEELLQNAKYQGISAFIRENFYFIRINAEELARQYFRSVVTEEITLEQIYKAIAMNGNLADDDIQHLITLERETEIDNIIGIHKNIEQIKSLIVQGEKVVLISDMYLDYKTVNEMLLKVDAIFSDIKLYVSSEVNKCKYGCNLYRYVKECENVEYEQWFHIGDNTIVDINEPKKLGIKTKLYPYEGLTRYEKELINKKEEDAYVQLTIGSARNTRLVHDFSGAAAIGCSIGGVILFPYVWWLIHQSLNKGIQRLYFIARDGYILKIIADIIIRDNNYNIKTFYIYGSRRAWRMASISGRNNDVEKFLTGAYLNNVATIGEFADVFQLTVHELTEFIPALKNLKQDQIMSPIVKEYIKKEVQRNKDRFVQFLSNIHGDKRQLIADYIRQEVDYSDDNFAFVELAGSGLTQGCLVEIIHDYYEKPIQTFYFKLDCVHVPKYCIFYDYIPSLMYLHIIIEMLARAPHGQTIGYQKDKDRTVPLCNNWEDKAIIEHGFYDYLNGIECYAEYFLSTIHLNDVKADKIDIIIDYIKYITRTPDKEVMEFLGGMPNNVTGREIKDIEYAPVLSNKDIKSIFLTQEGEPIETYYHGTAIEYSILRSGVQAEKRINFYTKHYDKFIGKLARLPKRFKSRNMKHYKKLFPYELLDNRIVLYGAGKVGKAIYQGIKRQKRCRIVQWVDTKYEEYQKKGLLVISPEEIGEIPCDQIVIAMLNEEQSCIIREALIKKGIPCSKILWVNLRAR